MKRFIVDLFLDGEELLADAYYISSFQKFPLSFSLIGKCERVVAYSYIWYITKERILIRRKGGANLSGWEKRNLT